VQAKWKSKNSLERKNSTKACPKTAKDEKMAKGLRGNVGGKGTVTM